MTPQIQFSSTGEPSLRLYAGNRSSRSALCLGDKGTPRHEEILWFVDGSADRLQRAVDAFNAALAEPATAPMLQAAE